MQQVGNIWKRVSYTDGNVFFVLFYLSGQLQKTIVNIGLRSVCKRVNGIAAQDYS